MYIYKDDKGDFNINNFACAIHLNLYKSFDFFPIGKMNKELYYLIADFIFTPLEERGL
jgi:hypothetical protein